MAKGVGLNRVQPSPLTLTQGLALGSQCLVTGALAGPVWLGVPASCRSVQGQTWRGKTGQRAGLQVSTASCPSQSSHLTPSLPVSQGPSPGWHWSPFRSCGAWFWGSLWLERSLLRGGQLFLWWGAGRLLLLLRGGDQSERGPGATLQGAAGEEYTAPRYRHIQARCRKEGLQGWTHWV